MANKKNKKKVQQNSESAKTAAASSSKVEASKAVSKKDAAPAKKAKAKKAKAKKKNEKPGFFARIKNYFRSVKSEMKRVVWPSKKELINYSVAVCVSLLVVGVVIALLDMLIGEGLVLFSSLRG